MVLIGALAVAQQREELFPALRAEAGDAMRSILADAERLSTAR